MKNSFLIVVFSFLVLIFSGCAEEYDYDLNDTTWNMFIYWKGGSRLEPDSITFNSDGTTSWGGTWKKTDALQFEWTCTFEDEDGLLTSTYYANFKIDLTELMGQCYNSRNIDGDFTAIKNE